MSRFSHLERCALSLAISNCCSYLDKIVEDKDAQPAARVSAASVLLGRGHGKAAQPVEVTGEVEHHLIDQIQDLDRPELKLINGEEHLVEE